MGGSCAVCTSGRAIPPPGRDEAWFWGLPFHCNPFDAFACERDASAGDGHSGGSPLPDAALRAPAEPPLDLARARTGPPRPPWMVDVCCSESHGEPLPRPRTYEVVVCCWSDGAVDRGISAGPNSQLRVHGACSRKRSPHRNEAAQPAGDGQDDARRDGAPAMPAAAAAAGKCCRAGPQGHPTLACSPANGRGRDALQGLVLAETSAHPAARFCEPPLQWKAVRAWVAPPWEGISHGRISSHLACRWAACDGVGPPVAVPSPSAGGREVTAACAPCRCTVPRPVSAGGPRNGGEHSKARLPRPGLVNATRPVCERLRPMRSTSHLPASIAIISVTLPGNAGRGPSLAVLPAVTQRWILPLLPSLPSSLHPYRPAVGAW
jgi:hypothetical protein